MDLGKLESFKAPVRQKLVKSARSPGQLGSLAEQVTVYCSCSSSMADTDSPSFSSLFLAASISFAGLWMGRN